MSSVRFGLGYTKSGKNEAVGADSLNYSNNRLLSSVITRSFFRLARTMSQENVLEGLMKKPFSLMFIFPDGLILFSWMHQAGF